jgi:hypothetical protein
VAGLPPGCCRLVIAGLTGLVWAARLPTAPAGQRRSGCSSMFNHQTDRASAIPRRCFEMSLGELVSRFNPKSSIDDAGFCSSVTCPRTETNLQAFDLGLLRFSASFACSGGCCFPRSLSEIVTGVLQVGPSRLVARRVERRSSPRWSDWVAVMLGSM